LRAQIEYRRVRVCAINLSSSLFQAEQPGLVRPAERTSDPAATAAQHVLNRLAATTRVARSVAIVCDICLTVGSDARRSLL